MVDRVYEMTKSVIALAIIAPEAPAAAMDPCGYHERLFPRSFVIPLSALDFTIVWSR
jgi:hypothetical protein